MKSRIQDEYLNSFFNNVKEGRGIDKLAFEKGIKWIYCSLLKLKMPEIVYFDSIGECVFKVWIIKSLTRCFVSLVPGFHPNQYPIFKKIDVLYDIINHLNYNFLSDKIIYDNDRKFSPNYKNIMIDTLTEFLATFDEEKTPELKDLEELKIVENMIFKDFRMGDVMINTNASRLHSTIQRHIGNIQSILSRPAVENILKENIPLRDMEQTVSTTANQIFNMDFFNIVNHHEYSQLGSIGHFALCASCDFLNQSKNGNNKVLRRYKAMLKSGCFLTYTFHDTVFAVQPPVHLALNTQGSLHSTEGPAIRFRNGEYYYFINGRSVPAWIFETKDMIRKEDFLNETNVEVKAAIYEVLGHKKMMELLGAETVHTSEIQHANGDVETVELLKTREKFPEIWDDPFAWVKVTCPSTGTHYLLGVEPKHTNAAEAVASLSMFNEKEYSFNFRT